MFIIKYIFYVCETESGGGGGGGEFFMFTY